MAPLMRRFRRSPFSMKSASRCKITSSTPPTSPAATILQYRRSNAFGCLEKDSLSVVPPSTSSHTSPRIFLSLPGFCCCSKICMLRSNGRPASCNVLSWRVKFVMILVLTRPGMENPKPLPFFLAVFSFSSFGLVAFCSRTSVGNKPCPRRDLLTSSLDGASMVPLWALPAAVIAL